MNKARLLDTWLPLAFLGMILGSLLMHSLTRWTPEGRALTHSGSPMSSEVLRWFFSSGGSTPWRATESTPEKDILSAFRARAEHLQPCTLDDHIRGCDAPHFLALWDAGGSMSAAEALSAQEWHVRAGGVSEGYRDGVYWLALRLASGSADIEHPLVSLGQQCGQFQAWLVSPSNEWKPLVSSTFDRPRSPELFFGETDPSFAVRVPAGESAWVVMRSLSSPTQFSLRVRTPDGHSEGMADTQGLVYGAAFGGFLAMILYHLLQGLVIRDRLHLSYVAYLICHALTQGALTGHLFAALPDWAIWPAYRSNNTWFVFSLYLLTVFMGISTESGPWNRSRKRWEDPIWWLLLCGLSLGLVAALFPNVISRVVANLASLAGFSTMVFLAGIAARRSVSARYFLAAFSIGIAAALLTTLSLQGILPLNTFTRFAFVVAGPFDAVLLSYALGRTFREARDRARKAEEMAVKTRLETLGQASVRLGDTIGNALAITGMALEEIADDCKTGKMPDEDTVAAALEGVKRGAEGLQEWQPFRSHISDGTPRPLAVLGSETP